MELLHPLQKVDDPRDLCGDAEECRHYFQVLERCSLAESYLKSDLSVVLELCPKGNVLPVVIGPCNSNVEAVNTSIFILQFHAANSYDREHGNEEMMFVVDVEGVESENIGVPSRVTFHAIDNKIEHGDCYASPLERTLKLLPRFLRVDGKLSVSGSCREHPAPSDIESAMQIVNCISNNQSNIGAQSVVSKSVVENLFPRCRIDVHSGAVTVRRGVESFLDIRDVLVGPLDF